MQILSKLRQAISLLGLTTLIGFVASSSAEATANTTDAPALRSIAFEHYLSGDSDAALDYYQKAIDTAARDYGKDSSYIAQLYYEMGTLALDAKKFIRSEAYLQKAVQHNPNSIMARVKFAECLELRGKNDEALTQIHAALSKHSSSPEAREALVSWLQANHRMASAIHESYNLSVAANGRAVPPPVSQVIAQNGDPTLVAAIAPAVVVAPAAIAPNSPLKLFPWMDKKSEKDKDKDKDKAADKKAADKSAGEKKAEKKKDEAKKTEAKKSEVKKAEKKSSKAEKQKEAKAAKHARDKSSKHPGKIPSQQVEVAQEEMHALRTSAKAIKTKKADAADSGDSRSEEPTVSAQPKNNRKDVTPRLSMPIPTAVMPSKPLNRKQSMVPPPPPLVPTFGGMPMYAPPQSVYAKPPSKVAKKPKPAPVAAAPKESAEAPSPKPAASSGGDGDDPNFLLEWGDTHAKKKK